MKSDIERIDPAKYA